MTRIRKLIWQKNSNMLIHKRRLELAMESHRFFDLVRWDKTLQEINGTWLDNQQTSVVFESPKNDFFPIPEEEVIRNQGNLLKYAGW